MKSKNYYTLVASLPHLPRFDKAQNLPINRERLIERLKMLSPGDLKLADKAAEFIAWRRHPAGQTDTEIVTIYNQGVSNIYQSPLLKPLFEFSINQRTILAALRRQQAGLPKPKPSQPWGAGDLVEHIERNWDKPAFKLVPLFPWILQAQAYLKQGESLKLEYMLMNMIWNYLDRLLFKNHFGFEVVIAYLLKWDILRQWLSYDKEASKKRFEKLATEIVDEYQHLN